MALGLSGTWTDRPARTSNAYFKVLLGLEWSKRPSFGMEEYRAPVESVAALLGTELAWGQEGQYVYMTPSDMVIKRDRELSAIAKEYAADNSLFVPEFAAAWTKVMNADRFRGPAGSECDTATQPAS
jgi:catalase-peroxidase